VTFCYRQDHALVNVDVPSLFDAKLDCLIGLPDDDATQARLLYEPMRIFSL